MFLVFTEKVNFFIVSFRRKKTTFFQSFLDNFSKRIVFSGYNIGYKHSLHLENGL